MNEKAKFYIDKLQLKPHPEGGYFKEVYRSAEEISEASLPDRYKGKRNFGTSIYFLLEGEQVSLLHKLQSDEIWHFYDGSPVKIYIINKNGKIYENILGKDLDQGEEIQVVINKGCWFCAEVLFTSSFSLFGCTVSPGFSFDDYEPGERKKLLKEFPLHKSIIKKFSK